jgi:hypothetical protein
MVSEAGRRWIDAAIRWSRDDNRDGILCPQNQDDILLVEWLPFSSGEGGEWWFHCPTCKAENFALVRHPEEPV